MSASKRTDFQVIPTDFEEAKKLIEEAESKMGNAFSSVGRSELTADIDLVRKILERSNSISEKQLRRMVWRDIDDKKFVTVIDTIVKGGDARREYTDPTGKVKEIWYHWKGNKLYC